MLPTRDGESRSNSWGSKTVNLGEGTDLWMIGLNENGDVLFQKSYNFGNRDVLMSSNPIWNSTRERNQRLSNW